MDDGMAELVRCHGGLPAGVYIVSLPHSDRRCERSRERLTMSLSRLANAKGWPQVPDIEWYDHPQRPGWHTLYGKVTMSDVSPHRVEIPVARDDLRRFNAVGWYGEHGVSVDAAAAGTCEVCEAEDRRRESLMEAHMPTHEASSDCSCGVPCYSQRGYMLHLYEVIENDVREQ